MEIRREDAAEIEPNKVESLPHWSIHDLRRTAATGLQSLGFSDDVVDRVLNHVMKGVRKSYNHFARNPEKTRALNAWAAHVEEVVSGESGPSNVVELVR